MPSGNETETAPIAVLDVGSNTIRLLVGHRRGDDVEPLIDRSEFARLGKDVDRTGALQDDRIEAGVEAIRDLARVSRELGAERLIAIATSAVRDASNGPDFVARVERETGVRIQIVSGIREAELTFRGATLGVSVTGGMIVCDLGGGSAELLSADSRGILWSASEPLGSNRLTERFIHENPPSVSDLHDLTRHVVSVLGGLPSATAANVILTGGTASHLALLSGREGVMVQLAPADVAHAVEIVSRLTADQVVDQYSVRPERARVLPAGLATLLAVVTFYQAESVTVTRRGIREGALLDATA